METSIGYRNYSKNIPSKMEHIVANFKILLKFKRDNTLPLYPPPITRFAWSHNSQQLHLIPTCRNFMLLCEVDNALSLSPPPINTHPIQSQVSYSCKLVVFASIFCLFCSQNLSYSFSKNHFFDKQTLLGRSTIYLVH
jgi:hypothetical protein